ncbi:hypothetical protein ACFLWZ_06580, partial [Chloroflexota bacterium]
GELTIDRLGGPEVIPIGEQPAAVQSGVVDMGALYGSRVGGIIPAFQFFLMSRYHIGQNHEVGFYKWVNDKGMKDGVMFLGMLVDEIDSNSFMYISKRIPRPEKSSDLKGLIMGTYGAMKPWVEGLGMTYQSVPGAERYTAIERGVTDGTVVSLESGVGYSLPEVCSWFINHGAYGANQTLVINKDVFEGLPPHLQDLMKEGMAWVEENAEAWQQARLAEVFAYFEEGGMEIVEFSEAEKEKFLAPAYEAKWDDAYDKWPREAMEAHAILVEGLPYRP